MTRHIFPPPLLFTKLRLLWWKYKNNPKYSLDTVKMLMLYGLIWIFWFKISTFRRHQCFLKIVSGIKPFVIANRRHWRRNKKRCTFSWIKIAILQVHSIPFDLDFVLRFKFSEVLHTLNKQTYFAKPSAAESGADCWSTQLMKWAGRFVGPRRTLPMNEDLRRSLSVHSTIFREFRIYWIKARSD